MMGHLRCGTTKSDDGSLALEDLTALPDLVAGATAEFLAALAVVGLGPVSQLIQLLPSGVSWKTRIIVPWMLNADFPLERFVCLIDGAPDPPKWRATIPKWFQVEGTLHTSMSHRA